LEHSRKLSEFFLTQLTAAPAVVVDDETHDPVFFVPAAVVSDGSFVKK
jgi:hypothetical protein